MLLKSPTFYCWLNSCFQTSSGHISISMFPIFMALFTWNYHIKMQRHHFAKNGLYRQSYGFPSSHASMWELDYKEGWVPKNWCFGIVVLEKTLKSPLDWKEIKSVNPKGNQAWIFIGKTVDEAEAPVIWPPDAKSQLIGKDLGAGKDWGKRQQAVLGVAHNLVTEQQQNFHS